MACGLSTFVRTLKRVAALLDRFIDAGDGRAFETLMCWHGGLVLSVCRRIAKPAEEADDAFQATFMTLLLPTASRRRMPAAFTR
jgi:RNA polymerase sigma-70 factor (ECF subfamily)